MQMKSVKKFRAFLGGFILFLALMFTVGSVNVKAAAPKLNKKKITIYVGHTGKLKVNNARKKVKWTSSKKQIADRRRWQSGWYFAGVHAGTFECI